MLGLDLNIAVVGVVSEGNDEKKGKRVILQSDAIAPAGCCCKVNGVQKIRSKGLRE